MNKHTASPDTAQPEQQIKPFITEEYGLGGVMDQIERLVITESAVVSCRSKVNAGGRYVLEIEVVATTGQPSLPPSLAFEPTAPSPL